MISASQTGAVADDIKHSSAGRSDLISEQRDLMDENTATLGRFAGPQTPANRPRLLTENGLLTSLLVLEDSPLDHRVSERPRKPSKEGTILGAWSPGRGPHVNISSSLGPRHERWEASPSDRRIRRRPRDPPKEGTRFGDWLPGHGPQVDNDLSLAAVHDGQEDERVDSRNRPPRPWEL